jgi:pimeloyl-ACP methyl ester carboxylesterase
MESVYFRSPSETSIHVLLSRPSIVDNKPLIIFLHYCGGASSTWYKLTSSDSSTSLRSLYPIAAIDLRGSGKSSGPLMENASDYSIPALASDIVFALEQLQNRSDKQDRMDHGFIMVGHSMGAKVALATLSGLSARLLGELKGLILVAPAPPTPADLPLKVREQQKAAYETQQSIRWTLENILSKPENLTEEDHELVLHDTMCGSKLAKQTWFAEGLQENISQHLTIALESIRNYGLHISILVGEFDMVEPKEQVDVKVRQFLERNGMTVSLKIVENVRHLIPLESPEAIFNEISKF